MNEFLQQFVTESRELVDTASDGLLALERSPQDAERLDEVFRAFHTLKGGAGIVKFTAMERAVHAAEDVLTAARTGTHPLTPARVSQCLACLDQVLQWAETIADTGQLPEEASTEADRVIRGFGTPHLEVTPTGEAHREPAQWLEILSRKHHAAAAGARSAVRFRPARDSFYHGEDPLARMMSLPGLRTLDFEPGEAWGPLDALDPFRSNLVLTALSTASVSDLRAHLQGHTGECDVAPIAPAKPIAQALLPPSVTAIVSAQRALLAECPAPLFAGCVGSAGLVAANALAFCNHPELAERISQATQQSLQERSAGPLQQALTWLVTQEPESAADGPVEQTQSPEPAVRTLRVDAERVDALVRLAGELMVVNNAIAHVVKLARAGDPSVSEALKSRHGTLQQLIGELQRSVLEMRVRPLRVVLQRFPRLVREMSASFGKSVELVIEGDETEADKAIVEMLSEPLLHIVRNAIDHGVESRERRAVAGKPSSASLRISARRSADRVVIEVSDDGPGIDLTRVRDLAVARGEVTADQLRTMTDADVIDLIFAPGFSTAEKVTQVSGRGVGMDAVRRAVERIGGHVSVATRAGQGTTVKLSLPFSVMMTHVMTVEAGGQMFGLPLEAVIETVRVPETAMSMVGSAPAVVLRKRTLPLIDLATVLGVEVSRPPGGEATLVVAAANGAWGAFRVDRAGDRLELILKPLEGLLAGMPGIIGTTLLGDGRVLLVLDVGALLQ